MGALGATPQVYGAALVTADAASLALINPQGMTPGTRVRRLDTNTDWVIEIGGSGVAIAGITGAEWVEDTGGGGGAVETVTATTANGINNTDPANPIVLNAGASNAGLMSAANFSKLALLQVLPRYSATLGAPASEITVTGLAGNTDIAYRIDFSIIVAATSKCCPIPNGSESNLKAQVADFVAGAALATTWRLGKNGSLETTFTAGTVLTGRGYIYASTAHSGYRRFSLSVYADTGTDDVYYVEGVLTETATELTQFSVQPAAANGYDTGSWLTLTALG